MSIKYLIVGSGRQGLACAYFLLKRFEDSEVTLLDSNPRALVYAEQLILSEFQNRTDFIVFDIKSDIVNTMPDCFKECDCIISCVPYFYNIKLTEIAIDLKKNFCDLGGNIEIVRRQEKMYEKALEQKVSIVPDCGVCPGTGNVLAEYWHNEGWKYKSIKIMCGGLPENPTGILKYGSLFSVYGLLNEYLDPCQILEDGKLKKVNGLSGLEEIDDQFEAFYTSGGTSLGPISYYGRLNNYYYKTIRYKGHRNVFKGMQEMGLFDDHYDIQIKEGALSIESNPREIIAQCMHHTMDKTKKDILKLIVEVKGVKDGKNCTGTIKINDKSDEVFTAMERTTGFNIAILAAYICGSYEKKALKGVYVPFQIINPRLLIQELEKFNVLCKIEESIDLS